MVAVGKLYGKKEGVKNKIVFAKGEIESPEITRIVKIAKYNETQLDEVRRDLYETERAGIQQQTEGIFKVYTRFDFKSYGNAGGGLRQGQGYNNQLGTNRGTGGRTSKATYKRKRSPLTPVVHTFKDVAGRSKTVIKVGTKYEVEGNAQTRLYDSIEAAVEAHNRNAIRRYANKYNTTPTIVKNKLASDPDFLAKER